MDKEFHYFATGLVAKKAGFSEDEAEIIAYEIIYYLRKYSLG